MARIRTVKPELFLHEGLAELPVYARLLFIGLFTQADRRGRLEDRPRRIKAQIFPYDDVDTDELLDRLYAGGFLTRYEVNGQRLIQIDTFEVHQRCNLREPESSLPPIPVCNEPPPGQHRTIPGDDLQDEPQVVDKVKEYSDTIPVPCMHVNARVEGEGKGKGKEGNKNPAATHARAREGETLAEQVFRDCFEQSAEKITKHFPHVDFELEVEKCVANYRSKPPPVDPLLQIFKWFERAGVGMAPRPRPGYAVGKSAGQVGKRMESTVDAAQAFVRGRRT